MIGQLKKDSKEVAIIGAGISGLLIGLKLKRLGFKVKIYESSHRTGGLIASHHHEYGLSEQAAHSLLVSDEHLDFFKSLQIPLVGVNPKSKSRFILRDQRARKLPLGIIEFLSLLIRVFKKRSPMPKDSTLRSWGETYLGKNPTQFLLTPFVSGIFACLPEDLTARIAFPELPMEGSLYQWMKKGRKKSKMMVPELGMESLVKKMTEELADDIFLNHPISDLPSLENIVLTTPPNASAKLIHQTDPLSAQKLQNVKFSPLVSISIFAKESGFKKTPSGVGLLAPKGQGIQILGVLFNSSSFEHRSNKGFVSLTCMIGGTENPNALLLSDEEILKICAEDLNFLFGLDWTQCVRTDIFRWNQAIPIYNLDLEDAWNSLRSGWASVPGHVCFGNWTGDVSIRKMIAKVNSLQ